MIVGISSRIGRLGELPVFKGLHSILIVWILMVIINWLLGHIL